MRLAWPLVEPETLVETPHIGVICRHLEAVTRGEILRLLITLPPRHGKSLLVSVLWPAWIWTWRPEWRSLFVSHSATLATEHSRLCRILIESEWYRRLFSGPAGWALASDQNAKDNYRTTRHGHRFAVGLTAGITGHGGDLIGIDDPLAVTDAYSEAARAQAKYVIGKVLPTRLNDQRTGRIVMIMQRVHEDDPGAFMKSGGCEHLNLPSEYEPDRSYVTHRRVARAPLREVGSGTVPTPVLEEFAHDWRTTAGELLFPERFPREILERLKKPDELGEEGFAAQHQHRPTPAGGLMFKVSDWRFWKPDGFAPDHSTTRPRGCYPGPARPLPEEMDHTLISVDATFRHTTDGSFVAIHVWGARGSDRFLLDRVHARMDFDETLTKLLGVISRWPEAREKVIEAKANGDAIISTLENKHGISGIVPENPGSDNKEKRAAAMLPYHRAGNVHLPDGAPWLEEYIAEHASFPLGKTNDDVDAQSQGLRHLEKPDTVADKWARADPSSW